MSGELRPNPTHVIAPINGHGITKGKMYKIIYQTPSRFTLENDKGIECVFSFKNCSTIQSLDWHAVIMDGKSLSEGMRKATPAQIIAWFILAMAILMSFAYMMQHRTNFQELVPEYTDDDGSTLFIERK